MHKDKYAGIKEDANAQGKIYAKVNPHKDRSV